MIGRPDIEERERTAERERLATRQAGIPEDERAADIVIHALFASVYAFTTTAQIAEKLADPAHLAQVFAGMNEAEREVLAELGGIADADKMTLWVRQVTEAPDSALAEQLAAWAADARASLPRP